MNVRVAGAFALIGATLLIAYIVQRPVEVHKSTAATPVQTPATQLTNTQAAPSAAQPLVQPAQMSTAHPAGHLHTESSPEIPEAIRESIAAQRLPAAELITTAHPLGGYTTNLKGQYRTVSVAVRQADGSIAIVEQRIDPITDGSPAVSIPPVPAAPESPGR